MNASFKIVILASVLCLSQAQSLTSAQIAQLASAIANAVNPTTPSPSTSNSSPQIIVVRPRSSQPTTPSNPMSSLLPLLLLGGTGGSPAPSSSPTILPVIVPRASAPASSGCGHNPCGGQTPSVSGTANIQLSLSPGTSQPTAPTAPITIPSFTIPAPAPAATPATSPLNPLTLMQDAALLGANPMSALGSMLPFMIRSAEGAPIDPQTAEQYREYYKQTYPENYAQWEDYYRRVAAEDEAIAQQFDQQAAAFQQQAQQQQQPQLARPPTRLLRRKVIRVPTVVENTSTKDEPQRRKVLRRVVRKKVIRRLIRRKTKTQ